MAINVKLPDGRTIRVNTDDENIARKTVRDYLNKESQAAPAPSPTPTQKISDLPSWMTQTPEPSALQKAVGPDKAVTDYTRQNSPLYKDKQPVAPGERQFEGEQIDRVNRATRMVRDRERAEARQAQMDAARNPLTQEQSAALTNQVSAVDDQISKLSSAIKQGNVSGRAASGYASAIKALEEKRADLLTQLESGGTIDTTVGDVARELVNAPLRGATNLVMGGVAGIKDLAGYETGADETRVSRDDFLASRSAPLSSEQNRYLRMGSAIGEGLGSTAPLLAGGVAGLAGRAAGYAGTAASAALVAGAGADEQDARVYQERLDGLEVSKDAEEVAEVLGGVVNLSQLLPVKALLGKVPAGKGPEVLNAISSRILSNKAGRITAAGVAEGAQEAAVGVAQDLIEKGVYNEEQSVGESALQDFALGAVVGGGIRGGVEALTSGGVAQTEPKTKTQEDVQPILLPTSPKKSRAYTRERNEATKQIQAVAEDTTKDWKDAPSIEAVNSFARLKGVDNDAPAVFRTNEDGSTTILINTSGVESDVKALNEAGVPVTPEEVVRGAILHEGLGHYGLKQRFDQDLEAVMLQMYENSNRSLREKVDEIESKYSKIFDKQKLSPAQRKAVAMEEFLAFKSEKGPAEVNLLDKALNFIKEFVRNTMGRNMQVSEREALAILAQAQRTVLKGTSYRSTPTLASPDAATESQVDSVGDPRYMLPRGNFMPVKKAFNDNRDSPSAPERGYVDENLVRRDKKGKPVLPSYVMGDAEAFAYHNAKANYYGDRALRFAPGTKPHKNALKNAEDSRKIAQKYAPEFGRERRTLSVSPMVREAEIPKATAEDLDPANKYMLPARDRANLDTRKEVEQLTRDEQIIANEVLAEINDQYQPIYRTQEEAKAAARQKGLGRSRSKLDDLDVRLFQYDEVAKRFQKSLASLVAGAPTKRDGSLDISESTRDQMRKELLRFNQLIGQIFDDQGQIGRALNAMKQIEFTRQKIQDISDVMDDYAGSGELVDALMNDAQFDKLMIQMRDMSESGNSAGAALVAQQAMKPYWWQYILTARHAMLLSGLGTTAVNTYDNLGMLSRDLQESFIGGFTPKTGISPLEPFARMYGLVRALVDSGTYKNTMAAFRDGPTANLGRGKVEVAEARIPGLSKVNDFLYAQDVFFRAFHMNANLYALGVRKAEQEGFDGAEAASEGATIAMNPTEDMLEEAKRRSNEALFVDDPSIFAKTVEDWSAIRPNMNAPSQAAKFFLKTTLPFLRVTERILMNVFTKRSPLFFLDKRTRQDIFKDGKFQTTPEASTAYIRALYGTALMTWYWFNAGEAGEEGEEGFMTGEGPLDGSYQENYKSIKAREATGYRPDSIVKDGNYVDIARNNLSLLPLGVENNVANSVARARRQYDKRTSESAKKSVNQEVSAEENALNFMGSILSGMLSVLRNQSYVSGLDPFLKIGQGDVALEDEAPKVVGGLASQFVPAALRQYNQMYVDDVKRDTKGEGFSDTVGNMVASGVPGLSEGLPAQVDTLGQEVKQTTSISNLKRKSPINNKLVAQELFKLQKSSGKNVVSPKERSMEIEGVSYDIPADLLSDFKREAGLALSSDMSSIFSDEELMKRYQDLPIKEKLSLWRKVSTNARKEAKKSLLPKMEELYKVQIANQRKEMERK